MTHARIARTRRPFGRLRDDTSGFTLLELIVIGLVATTLMGFAMMGLGSTLPKFRARSAVSLIKQQLSMAREIAISQQREVRVKFEAPNRIVLTRLDEPDGETELSEVVLEGNVEFIKPDDLAESPDPWGGADAIAFGDAQEIRFRRDGALVDLENEFVSGRVFVSIDDRPEIANVVSVFGPTGRLRSYELTGTTWD